MFLCVCLPCHIIALGWRVNEVCLLCLSAHKRPTKEYDLALKCAVEDACVTLYNYTT